MPDKPTAEEAGWADDDVAQRAIVLQVLRDDHDERWSREQLEREIYDIEPQAIAEALERLRQEGVVHLSGQMVWASRAAFRLDALGMVSI
jgi:DNA-binding HxlR family transcriptional regulator